MFDFRLRKVVFLVLLVACCFAAGSSQAATISFNTTTPIGSILTDWLGTLSFPQFNSALGTLDIVQIDLSGSLSTVLTITNSSPTGSSGTAKT